MNERFVAGSTVTRSRTSLLYTRNVKGQGV